MSSRGGDVITTGAGRASRRAPSRRTAVLVATGIAVVAVAVRVPFYGQISGDYTAFVDPWYRFIASHGGLASLKFDFANYNPPYLYLLAVATSLPVPEIVAVKSISVIFDAVLALFVYLVVDLQDRGRARPLMCAAAVALGPTVVINSADWGQCDSIYASFCLGSLYFLLKRRPWWASVFFGVALSFKLQAVFFLPVLLIVLAATRGSRVRSLLTLVAVPVVFVVMLAPALIAGRGLGSLLAVYPTQVATGGQVSGPGATAPGQQAGNSGFPPAGGTGNTPGRATGPSSGNGVGTGVPNSNSGRAPAGAASPGVSTRPGSFTYNAANFYQWIGRNASTVFRYIGFAATAAVLAGFAVVMLRRRGRSPTAEEIVLLTGAVVLVVPFLLPDMHERYFYLADVMCVVVAGHVTRLAWTAVLAAACSLAAYAPFLWGVTVVDLGVVAAVQLCVVVAVGWRFVSTPAPPPDDGVVRAPPWRRPRSGVATR